MMAELAPSNLCFPQPVRLSPPEAKKEMTKVCKENHDQYAMQQHFCHFCHLRSPGYAQVFTDASQPSLQLKQAFVVFLICGFCVLHGPACAWRPPLTQCTQHHTPSCSPLAPRDHARRTCISGCGQACSPLCYGRCCTHLLERRRAHVDESVRHDPGKPSNSDTPARSPVA